MILIPPEATGRRRSRPAGSRHSLRAAVRACSRCDGTRCSRFGPGELRKVMASPGFPRAGDAAEAAEAITGRVDTDSCGHGLNEP